MIKTIKRLSKYDVNTESKQATVLDNLQGMLEAADAKAKRELPIQLIANNMATVAMSDHETEISDDLLDSMRDGYINNVALWCEEAWNHVHYDDSNATDRRALPQLEALMQFCHDTHLDPNDCWVEDNGFGEIKPVSAYTLQDVLEDAE